MLFRQLAGSAAVAGPAPHSDSYHRLSPEGRVAALTLLFSRASLPAPELAGLGADQANARVGALVGGRPQAQAALWEVRRLGLAALMRERRYDLYVLPDESREILWPAGARELRTRRPPITFVVDSGFSPERFNEAGAEAASALLYDLAALIAFVRSEEAPVGPNGILVRRAQLKLAEYMSVRETVVSDSGGAPPPPARMAFLIEIGRRAGLIQVSAGEGERLHEGPMASAWLKASPGRRLARVMAAWAAQLAGAEVDALLVMDAARWLRAPGRGVWVKGFAEAVSHFEDEPYPAYRLAGLIRALQRLAWMGAVFMWKVRWSEAPPESDQAANVSVKTAPSQRRGLPPLADVAFGLTAIGEALWTGISDPRALLQAARLVEEGAGESDSDGEAPRDAGAGGPGEPPAIRGEQLPLADGPVAHGDGREPPRHRAVDGGLETARGEEPPAAPTGGVALDEELGSRLPADEPSAFVQPNFEILVPRNMQPDRLVRLLELCSVQKADRMVHLKLEPDRVVACVRAGRWAPSEVMDLLTQASRHELPQNVRYTLMEALRPLGRVQLMDGILVRADDEEVARALGQAAAASGVVLERLSPEAFWMERRYVPALVRAAEAAGYPVRAWVRGARFAYPVEWAQHVASAVDAASRHAARESGWLVERRPPPSLVRGHRDLVFVAPEGELDVVVPQAARKR